MDLSFSVPCIVRNSGCEGVYDITFGKTKNSALKAYIAVWISVLSDSPLGLKPRPCVGSFNKRLLLDFYGTAISYNKLAAKLMRVKTLTPDGALGSETYELLEEFKQTPVTYEYIAYIRSGRADILAYLLSFLMLGKKYQREDDVEELRSSALRAWNDLEDRLDVLDIPDWVDELKLISSALLTPFFEHVNLPKHGGGHVAERGAKSPMEKHKVIHFDCVVDKVFFQNSLSPDLAVDFRKVLPEATIWSSDAPYQRVSRLTDSLFSLVYKDVASLRSICQEPATYMYFQQSVRRALEVAIRRGPLYRFVRIEDQSHNSDAARAGSLHGQLDTLDLSAASDSLAWAVVKRAFSPKIVKYLFATRSRYVSLPDNSRREISKFAPMGSAVCFPIQSIFYTLVILREYHQYLWPGRRVTEHSIRQLLSLVEKDDCAVVSGMATIRVYGDDMICDSRVTDRVIASLSSLGFTINRAKSFTGSNCFRESCGGYYLNGADVTPVILKLKDPKWYLTPNVLTSLIQAANRAHLRGYKTMRMTLLKLAHYWPRAGRYAESLPRPLPYGENAILGDELFEVRQKERIYSGNTRPSSATYYRYQRDERRVLWMTTKSQDEARDENYAYVAWQRSPGSDGLTPNFSVKNVVPRDQTLEFKWVWIPT